MAVKDSEFSHIGALPDQSNGPARADLVVWWGTGTSLSVSLGAVQPKTSLSGEGPEKYTFDSHIEPVIPAIEGLAGASTAETPRMADRAPCPDMRFEGGKP